MSVNIHLFLYVNAGGQVRIRPACVLKPSTLLFHAQGRVDLEDISQGTAFKHIGTVINSPTGVFI